jgi:chlorite dismutase
MDQPITKPLSPKEGLYVLHLFYRLNLPIWQDWPEPDRDHRKRELTNFIEQTRQQPQTQVVTLGMLAKADLGLMVVAPDLHQLQQFEKSVLRILGGESLDLVYSFFSLTEQSEYTTTEEEYARELQAQNIESSSPQYAEKIEAFRQRIKHYTHDRMYPTLPNWEFFCFYPMNKRREGADNWYSLDFQRRKDLMKGHATVGRKYSGKILQLITGCTGLDDWEWGVTLFAHDPFEVKAIVYEMRFDEVSARYGEFGEFFTGLPLDFPEIYRRLGM